MKLKSIKNFISKLNKPYQKLLVTMTEIKLSGKENTNSLNNKDKPLKKHYKKLRRNSNKLFSIYKSIERMIKKILNLVIMFQFNRLKKDINHSFSKKKKPRNYQLINLMIKLITSEIKLRTIKKRLKMQMKVTYNNQKKCKKSCLKVKTENNNYKNNSMNTCKK